MENKAHALAAGIFTLVLAAAIALTVWWMSGQRDNTQEYILVTQASVTGLNTQALVRYRGIRAGKVLDIGVDPQDPRNILVRVAVDAGMPVTPDTVATLKFQGLTGLAYIQMEDPGVSRERLRSEGGVPPRIALSGSAFDDVAESALEAMREIRSIAERVNRVLSDANIEKLQSTLANLDSAADGLNAALAEVPAVVKGLERVVSEENVRRLDRTLANLEQVSREAAPLAGEARELLSSMQGLARRLDSLAGEARGELTQGTLPRLDNLLDDLSANSRQLGRLLAQLEESPNMLIFGRREQRRPGPGEAGFSAQ